MTEVVKPEAAKPEPRRFEPPPMQAAAPRDSKPDAAGAAPVWLGSQAAKISSPAPSMALARNLAPPPDVPKPLPPYTPVDAAASTPVAAPRVAASIPPSPISALPPAKPEPTPLPAKRNTTGDRSLTRVLGLKLGRVVLDPGHGGHDAGTHGPSGLCEKDVVLDVAQRLGALIEAPSGKRSDLHAHRRHVHSARRAHADRQRPQGGPVSVDPREFFAVSGRWPAWRRII